MSPCKRQGACAFSGGGPCWLTLSSSLLLVRRPVYRIEDSKILHGPFVPSGVRKPLHKPDRSLLEYVLSCIHNQIEKDWGDYKFAVLSTWRCGIGAPCPRQLCAVPMSPERAPTLPCNCCTDTEDDRIVVRFELESVDSERGLHAYMNVFAETGDVPTQYTLTRITEDWHSKPGDGYLYYMFRPPWSRVRPTAM